MGYEWLTTPMLYGMTFTQLSCLVIFPMMILYSCLNLKEIFFKEERVRDYNLTDVCFAIMLVYIVLISV